MSRPLSWGLAFLALLGGMWSLAFSVVATGFPKVIELSGAALVVANVAALVQSLRVPFPWPLSRSSLLIRNSARRAVFFDYVVAALWLVLAFRLAAERRLQGETAVLLLCSILNVALLVLPIIGHYGLAALRFWRPLAAPPNPSFKRTRQKRRAA